jgi:hypothetical protein
MTHPVISMMLANWQTAVALACVAAAVVYLVRRLLRGLRAPSASPCSTCTHAPVVGIKHKPLVPLDDISG